MQKQELFKQELTKILDIFKDVEPSKMRLMEGLIEEAAFIKAENSVLREQINVNGMVKIHPKFPDIQKPTEAAKQYLKNINTYSVVIKALNSILQKNLIEPDDEFDDFMQEMREQSANAN